MRVSRFQMQDYDQFMLQDKDNYRVYPFNMNSIRPAATNEQKVTIAAGNTKVRYAKVHNEGFVGSVVVKQHTRTSKTGTVYSVKEHKSNRNIPQRQFIGPAKELTEILKEDIIQLIKSAIER